MDLVQLEERQSPKLHVGSPNLSVPANFYGCAEELEIFFGL